MVMEIVKNIFVMPMIMRFIVVIGLFAPFIVIASAITGNITPYISDDSIGSIEIVIILVCSVPIMSAAFLIAKKDQKSRYVYIFGWVLICLSPLVLSDVRNQFDVFLIGALFNAFIGLFIGFYLFLSKDVQKYFESKTKV